MTGILQDRSSLLHGKGVAPPIGDKTPSSRPTDEPHSPLRGIGEGSISDHLIRSMWNGNRTTIPDSSTSTHRTWVKPTGTRTKHAIAATTVRSRAISESGGKPTPGKTSIPNRRSPNATAIPRAIQSNRLMPLEGTRIGPDGEGIVRESRNTPISLFHPSEHRGETFPP